MHVVRGRGTVLLRQQCNTYVGPAYFRFFVDDANTDWRIIHRYSPGGDGGEVCSRDCLVLQL